jgi:hypothetical protein
VALRTSPEAVRAAVETDSDIDVSPYIRTANVLADKVSAEDSDSLLSDALLTEIETYLAAHFYALRDQQFHSKKTADASAQFQGQTSMGLKATLWGQQAIDLDVSGYLEALSRERHVVSLDWLGLPPSEQTEYEDRD